MIFLPRITTFILILILCITDYVFTSSEHSGTSESGQLSIQLISNRINISRQQTRSNAEPYPTRLRGLSRHRHADRAVVEHIDGKLFINNYHYPHLSLELVPCCLVAEKSGNSNSTLAPPTTTTQRNFVYIRPASMCLKKNRQVA